jgi:hypothetical protein
MSKQSFWNRMSKPKQVQIKVADNFIEHIEKNIEGYTHFLHISNISKGKIDNNMSNLKFFMAVEDIYKGLYEGRNDFLNLRQLSDEINEEKGVNEQYKKSFKDLSKLLEDKYNEFFDEYKNKYNSSNSIEHEHRKKIADEPIEIIEKVIKELKGLLKNIKGGARGGYRARRTYKKRTNKRSTRKRV